MRLADRLSREIEGDVRFDSFTRGLFSTDASIYQIMPIGVVFPKHDEDVRRVVEITRDARVPLLPRGGGTSLAGQTVGEAVIVDCSKYLNRVLEVNAAQAWARIQPGVVLDHFNTQLRPTGLMFGPEVSPSSRATLGGMIGNNSCGARSVVYGKMVDHVVELRGFLANGLPFCFGRLSREDLQRSLAGAGPISHIVQTVNQLAITHREEVDRRFPKIMRRVAGYNLDEVGLKDGFNLAGLLVGSEGTLAVHTEARVRLVRRPPHRVVGVCHFQNFADSMAASAPITRLQPHAIELSDRLLLDLARESSMYASKLHFVRGHPETLLIVEFAGDALDPLLARLADLEDLMRDLGYGDNVVRVIEPSRQEDVWAVRKAGLGLFGSMKGDAKPLAFVEDTAVAPEHLPAFTAAFREILDRHGVRAAFYGHASVGCLHVRPILDLRHAEDLRKLRMIAEEVVALALRFGGSHSAEHGEGLARSEFNPKVFGETLYAAFKEIKAAFDPDGRMNPGKKVNAPPMDRNLRQGPGYRVSVPPVVLDHPEFGGFDKHVEMCNGNGQCRKSETGTMCPSYMVTRDEMHSTRGRANALRLAMTGALGASAFTSRAMHDVMDLCISCKACKVECPSRVDMAKLKYEFLVAYHREHGTPWRGRLFGNIATLAAIGAALAPLSNLPIDAPILSRVIKRLLRIHPARSLPRFARQTFWRWWQERSLPRPAEVGTSSATPVVLFVDTFSNYFEPEVAQAAVRVLEAAGHRVIVPRPTCCGRPFLSEGLHEAAVEAATRTLHQLLPYASDGYPIVGIEPSCILAFRDEYRYLLRSRAARQLADRTRLLEEFLAERAATGQLSLPLGRLDASVLLHGHCHQKAIATTSSAHALLGLVPGLQVREVDAGCCGMAGSFGYEAEHYTYSIAMAERVLLPAIRQAPPETVIVADGTSCRHQIRDGTGREAVHLAQVLAQSLGG